ncbi:hypothetical protein D777_01270 [Marinobacter nitratireducens]|uniref:Uncharacterized protein n=1 Tax=Marinobacter nitratireducens TaxID=1137280 RepID=A0A072N572_9GAMM|nr:hypothetical protein [Marinobacter nitratireducens]KEF32636.1 hypothetical protein D777_01270 [Marinobacter nitratireducens]TNE97032.1 MAG: hypothetical protein EP328_07115 [Gammaproteobacteria bacterium]
MIKSIALAGLLIVLLGFVGIQYYITSVPDLEAPIGVEEVRDIESEKSLVVTLVDADGSRFVVGLRGDVSKPEDAALFYIRNPDVIPYVFWPGLRSNDEKRVLEMLEDWLESHATDTHTAAVKRIHSVLKARN